MSLVSKRFRALCLAPQLVKEVSLCLRWNLTAPDASLRSLHCWMAANAQHLTSFTLALSDLIQVVDPILVMGCLATCCAMAPLEEMNLYFRRGQNPTSLAWLLSVRSTLTRLFVMLESPLAIDAPLQQCTALTRLTAFCPSLHFAPGCLLPSSLTHLVLILLTDCCIPSQARKLTSGISTACR